jgi:hypothetical protein
MPDKSVCGIIRTAKATQYAVAFAVGEIRRLVVASCSLEALCGAVGRFKFDPDFVAIANFL